MSVTDSTDSPRNGPRGARAPGAAARRLPSHAPPVGPGAVTWPGTAGGPAQETIEAAPRRTLSNYRRNQLIGAGIAAALHLVVLFGFNGHAPEKQAVVTAPEEYTIRLELPPIEPPETIEIVDVADAPVAPQLAPPMQMDLPGAMALSDFIQPLRPMIDPSLTSVGAITIPSVTTGNIGASGGVRLFDLKELDRAPRRLKTVMPVYPDAMRRAGISGEVTLLVIIDVNGRVEVERVLRSSAREFEAAAVAAAEQCQFEPPLRGGNRVNARYRWSIPFEIR